ncbi:MULTISPECIES: exodeoxyribonuclease VII small subunit [unclassified Synechococcus]|uniref:exodeoxyribonuclease VII small subunit n=1 Tax=unclassified Synechococcus TaxID=2626047 RepID=UPI001C227331|nr:MULTISPECIES: exodeoxyribonuclease VII small subunit [unclassified Synechococcus]
MAKSSPRSRASAQPADDASSQDAAGEGNDVNDVAQDLSFREAQTALELCLAQLQDQDLDVESMAGLYRRALAYAERCEAVLARVEQQVMQWDPGQPDLAPTPYAP